MKQTLFVLSFTLFALLFNKHECRAQQADSGLVSPGKVYYMFGFDFGPSSSQEIHASANITLIKNNYVLTYRGSTETELKYFNDYNGNNYNSERAVLIGKRFNLYTFTNLSLSTGLSYVKIVRRDESSKIINDLGPDHYDYIHKKTVGLPIEARFWNNYISKYVAFAITIAANINSKNSFYSLGFGLQLGKTRDSKTKEIRFD